MSDKPTPAEWLDGYIDDLWDQSPEHYWLSKVRDELRPLGRWRVAQWIVECADLGDLKELAEAIDARVKELSDGTG